MNSEEKIKWVRNRAYELEDLGGLGMMLYPLQPVVQEVSEGFDDFFSGFFDIEKQAATGEKPMRQVVVITVDEQKDILKRLEAQKLLKILEVREDDVLLDVFPKQQSPIKPKTLEHIARTLADKFTGGELVDALVHYGISRADIPYPNTKWRTLHELYLTLATSPNPEQRERLGGVITTFLHPLNFNADENESHTLVEDFNKYLKYDGYEIAIADDGDGFVLRQTNDKKRVAAKVDQPVELKRAAKREPAHPSPQPPTEENTQTGNQRVLDALEDALVRGFKSMSFDAQKHTAVQKIEITAMPELQVRSADRRAISSSVYITKKDDDFLYKGRQLNLSKKTDYYQAFAALYAKLPEGGEMSYDDLAAEIRSRVPKTKMKSADEMRKFIQRNLTDKSNGFMRYAAIPETEDNGKPLIEVVRGSGIAFNNKAG